MFQADVTKNPLSLDHSEAQKHKQDRRAFTLLSSERKHTKRKFSRSSMQLTKGQGQTNNHSYKFSSERSKIDGERPGWSNVEVSSSNLTFKLN